MRRYHHSPSIPFHIINARCLCEPVGSPVDGSEGSGAVAGPSNHSDASEGLKTASRIFIVSMWLAGVIIGVGLALELNKVVHGGLHYGLFVQAAGFIIAAVSILRHPGEGES